MSVLCFGEFAKAIKKATTQSDIEVVALLIDGIAVPLGLKNKNGDGFYYEKKEVSDLVNSRMNLPIDIQRSVDYVKNSIGKYFEDNVIPAIIVNTPIHLMDHIRTLLINDVTVPVQERNRLNSLAKYQSLSEFLGAVYLFTIQTPNDFNIPIEKRIKEFKAAIPPNSNTETYLLSEVGTHCPVCGNTFIKIKNGKAIPECCITEIYPHEPNENQLEILRNIEMPEYSFASVSNKIALCEECKNSYITHFSEDEYKNLLLLKKEIQKQFQAQLDIDRIELENSLKGIVDALIICDQTELNKQLLMDALKIEKKIISAEVMLRRKIEFFVTTYYNYINDLFIEAQKNSSFDFNILAQEIKLCCDKLIKKELTQSQIFNKMVSWVKNKTLSKDDIACEAIIAFFVQNCEVFHEIA